MKPIILVPGITASSLADANTFDFSPVWRGAETRWRSYRSALGRTIDARLQPSGRHDEGLAEIVRPTVVSEMAYEAMAQDLTRRFPHDPLYVFAYDWRRSNVENGARLADFVDELAEKLAPHGVEGFRFVTHSMGGLVLSAWFGAARDPEAHLDSAVLCAPPLRGSLDTLELMVRGEEGALGGLFQSDESSRRVRKSVRTWPSAFELLPWWPGSLVRWQGGEPVDLLRPEDWQSNIGDDDPALFRRRLADLARARTEGIVPLDTLPVALRQRLLVVAGTGARTPRSLQVERHSSFGGRTIDNYLRLEQMEEDREGDGTVHLESSGALRAHLRTLVVRRKGVRAAGLSRSRQENRVSFHGLFMRDSRVLNIVGRFLAGERETDRLRSLDRAVEELDPT